MGIVSFFVSGKAHGVANYFDPNTSSLGFFEDLGLKDLQTAGSLATVCFSSFFFWCQKVETSFLDFF